MVLEEFLELVETNYTGGQHAKNAVRTIELAGLDPGEFAVRLQ